MFVLLITDVGEKNPDHCGWSLLWAGGYRSHKKTGWAQLGSADSGTAR